MESHTTDTTDVATDVVTEEPAPEEALPTPEESTDNLSFAEALDKALDFSSEEEPKEEAKEEPKEEAKEEPKEEAEEDSKEEADPIESLTEDVGDDWTPKAARRFKQLKAELKDNRSEVDQLRQSLKEQEAKMKEMSGLVDNKDIDELQEKIAQYESDKMMSDLTETQAYKDAVTTPMNELLQRAEEIVSEYEIKNETLVDALLEPDQEKQDNLLTALLEDASDRDRARIYKVSEDMIPLVKRNQELMDNAESALKEAQLLEEQRRNTELAEQSKHRQNVTKNVVKRVSEKLPFLAGIESVDLSSIENKAAETDPSVIHPVDFAYNAVASQLLPVVVRELMGARKEADSLSDKLAEYEAAEPTMSGTPAADGTRRSSSDASFAEAISAALGS